MLPASDRSVISLGRAKRRFRYVLLIFLFPAMLNLQAAEMITVQGQVTDALGVPSSGLVNIQFTIYDAPAEGNGLWSDSLEVEIVDGIFTAILGVQQPIDDALFATPDRWLGINIGGAGELPERHRITTSPIAIHAKVAESLPPGSVDGGLLVDGALTLDKLAPCAPTEIIAMGPSGWACKSRGGNP
jgi:hypothetical protein